jgi:hypothetical protein
MLGLDSATGSVGLALRRAALGLALAGCVAGCVSPPTVFTCKQDLDCVVGGQAAECVQNHCALADTSCPTGFRFDTTAGPPYAGSCVTPAGDGAIPEVTQVTDGAGSEHGVSDHPTSDGPPGDHALSDHALSDRAPSDHALSDGPRLDAGPPADGSVMPNDAGVCGGLEAGTPDAGPPPPASVCSPDGWCWMNPYPTADDNFGLWAASATDAWAVGYNGALLHWNGTNWSGTVGRPDGYYYQAVSGVSSSRIWAVGTGPIVSFWNGRKWSDETLPIGSNYPLNGVWAGPGCTPNVWAVGDRGTALHRDSTGWHTFNAGTNSNIYAVWGTASGPDVWAVGPAGLIDHWNGSKWQVVTPAPTTADLRGIWGSSATDVYAVGDTVLHWNGSAWTPITALGVEAGPPPAFNAVSGHGPNDVWIVGGDQTNSYGEAVHWDGSRFTPVDASQVRTLNGVYTDGTTILAVGDVGRTLIATTGSTFSPLYQQNLGYDGAIMESAWGASPTDVWVVGAGGAYHWDGTMWAQPGWPWCNRPLAISGRASNDIWMVGQAGLRVHWNGSKLTQSTTAAVTADLYGVWSSPTTNDAWAAGAAGTLLHYDAVSGNWIAATPSPFAGDLHAVSGLGPTDVWVAAGTYGSTTGAVLRYNGSNWSVPLSTSIPVFGVWENTPTDAYAVGAGGTVWHYTGSWNSTSTCAGDLAAIVGTSSSNIWAVGGGGVFQWDGTTMAQSYFDPSVVMYGIGTAGSQLWAVGDNNVVIRH